MGGGGPGMGRGRGRGMDNRFGGDWGPGGAGGGSGRFDGTTYVIPADKCGLVIGKGKWTDIFLDLFFSEAVNITR